MGLVISYIDRVSFQKTPNPFCLAKKGSFLQNIPNLKKRLHSLGALTAGADGMPTSTSGETKSDSKPRPPLQARLGRMRPALPIIILSSNWLLPRPLTRLRQKRRSTRAGDPPTGSKTLPRLLAPPTSLNRSLAPPLAPPFRLNPTPKPVPFPFSAAERRAPTRSHH